MLLSNMGWWKQIKSLMIAGGGAFLAVIAEKITNSDFGIYTPIAVALASVLVNVFKTFVEEKMSSEETSE